MPEAGTIYSVKWLSPDEVLSDDDMVNKWRQLINQSDNPYVFYQSFTMWQYELRRSSKSLKYYLGVITNEIGVVLGIVPARIRFTSMSCHVGKTRLYSMPIQVLQLLGGDPLVKQSQYIYTLLIKSVFEEFSCCDAIDIDGLLKTSKFYNYLTNSDCNKNFLLHIHSETELNLLLLNESFDAYLSKFSSKTRYNLRRVVKQLSQNGGGNLRLVRVDSSSDVESFLQIAEQLSLQSTQYRAIGWYVSKTEDELKALTDVAESGALRSYILYCGENACAYVKGFQFNDIFYYDQIGYEESMNTFSPGTALLYLLIEDLNINNKPRYINFYYGNNWYKRQFATEYLPMVALMLFRKTPRNFIKLLFHSACRTTISKIKILLRKHSMISNLFPRPISH